MKCGLLVVTPTARQRYRRAGGLLGLCACLLGVLAGSLPAQAAPVYLSRSECRGGYWHVTTYDVSDPAHWVPIEDLPTAQPCGESTAPATPSSPAGTAFDMKYQDQDGEGRLLIGTEAPESVTGRIPIDVAIIQSGLVFTGSGYEDLIHQDPTSVSDGATVYRLEFSLGDGRGVPYEFQGQLQIGGILGRAIASGRYARADGSGAAGWQAAQVALAPLKFHIHAAVNRLVGSCWRIFHDPGCAGLGPEQACLPIVMGRNRGKYLCLH